ncbi:hypothetical protein [Arthrobacter sp. TB 23]|uniref:hypothetical protein n=1 Tax=Arthrobacter sp. TB 23 TaxID=494419 RepID=UPI0002D53989|nr:hypothetical protein [Arthrobacter sp. TB 23]
MVMMNRLRTWALARPGVFIIDAPGNDRLRWLVEAEIDRRGWQVALSPADAGLMLTIGTLPPGLSQATDVLWTQMPQPRHRQVIDQSDIAWQFDAAVAALTTPSAYEANPSDPATQLSSAQDATGGSDSGHQDPAHEMDSSDPDADGISPHDMGGHNVGEHSDHMMDSRSGDDMGGHDGHAMESDADPGMDPDGRGMDHSAHTMDHSAHSGHDMGGHMHHGGDVAGLAMAGTAPDRDGLELDELKVTLGPVLPGWPTGLVLKGSMQGDVLTGVSLSWLDGPVPDSAVQHSESDAAAVALDALAGFLLVAGWPLLARRARDARWALSTDTGTAGEREHGRRTAAAVARRVARSRFLAWSVSGIGDDDAGSAHSPRVTAARGAVNDRMTGDVLDRVRALAAVAAGDTSSLPRVAPEHIETLLEGAELAAARLIVASFVFDPAPVLLPDGPGNDRSGHDGSGHGGAGHD